MRRRPLRLAALLLLALGLSIALTSGCATTEGSGTDSSSCPYVSCYSEDGRNQCVAAGCACNPKTNGCSPLPKG